MTQPFYRGDIVNLKGSGNLYIIVETLDMSYIDKGETHLDIECELMQITPILREGKIMSVSHSVLTIEAKRDSDKYREYMEFIEKERKLKGWHGEADYMAEIRFNDEFEEEELYYGNYDEDDDDLFDDDYDVIFSIESRDYSKPNFEQNVIKGDLKEEKVSDVIRYDKLETTDQCLDAINHLYELNRVFGDEAYLQLIEVVHKRLIELVK